MSKILGKDVTISVYTGTDPQYVVPGTLAVIACGRACALITIVQVAGKSTTGSGTWAEYKALVNGWEVTSDGICTVGENIGLQTLRQLQSSLTPVVVSFKEEAGGTIIYHSGEAIITNIQTSKNYNDLEIFSIRLQGTGQLFTDGVFGLPPPGVYVWHYFTDVPSPGFTTLDIRWEAAQYPEDSFTLRTISGAGASYNTGITSLAFVGLVITTANTYTFSVKSVNNLLGDSAYSAPNDLAKWPL